MVNDWKRENPKSASCWYTYPSNTLENEAMIRSLSIYQSMSISNHRIATWGVLKSLLTNNVEMMHQIPSFP